MRGETQKEAQLSECSEFYVHSRLKISFRLSLFFSLRALSLCLSVGSLSVNSSFYLHNHLPAETKRLHMISLGSCFGQHADFISIFVLDCLFYFLWTNSSSARQNEVLSTHTLKKLEHRILIQTKIRNFISMIACCWCTCVAYLSHLFFIPENSPEMQLARPDPNRHTHNESAQYKFAHFMSYVLPGVTMDSND